MRHAICLIACLAAVGRGEPSPAGEGEPKELIMLEIERLNYPGENSNGGVSGVVKRQAQVEYGGAPGQYVVRTADQAGNPQPVPPEYLTLLQQLSPQQGQPREIDQVFITRSPQDPYAPPPAAPVGPPRLTPEQQQQRRLQEEQANKHIREQQQRALQTAQQTGQFAPGFQPPQSQYQQLQQPQTQYQQLQQPQSQYQQLQQPQTQYQQLQQPQSQYQQLQQPQYQPQEVVYQQQPPAPVPVAIFQPQPKSQPQPQYDNEAPEPQYYQQTRSIRPAAAPAHLPDKFSYSQVQFGPSDQGIRETLAPRLVSIEQRLKQQEKQLPYYSQPQQQPQPAQQQQTPTQPQHPEQYLIETTKPTEAPEEAYVRIPRPRPQQSLYYRPDPVRVADTLYTKQPVTYTTKNYQERNFPVQEVYTTIPKNYQERRYPVQELYTTIPKDYREPEPYTTIPKDYRQPSKYSPQPQYVQRPQTPEEPSRSAIYVQQSGISKRITTQPPTYNSYPGYSPMPRVPTPQGQRALTAAEIAALSKAGFNVSPLTLNSLQESSEISPSYDEDVDVYRAPNSKRQSQYVDERKPPGKYPKRIPKPVPLTETERKLLADQGIRNLYRVESAESKDAPVTYVLAIDNAMLRKRESSETQSSRDN